MTNIECNNVIRELHILQLRLDSIQTKDATHISDLLEPVRNKVEQIKKDHREDNTDETNRLP